MPTTLLQESAQMEGGMTSPLNRIVYLFAVPPTDRDRKRFGIDFMISEGVAVRIMDMTALFNPSLTRQVSQDVVQGTELTVIRTTRELCAAQGDLANADFIVDQVGFNGSLSALKLYRLLRTVGTPCLTIESNAYPGFLREAGPGVTLGYRVSFMLRRLRERQIKPIRSLMFRMPLKLLGVSPAALAVHGGHASASDLSMFPKDASTRRVYAHCTDFELYRDTMKEPAKATNMAVYIDENMGFQRDLLALGAKSPISPARFYPRLRGFFDRIEREFGLKVVIACNPKADYADHPGLFGDRQIVRNAVAALIRDSRLVLAHSSTAIGLAVMFRRPTMLIATRESYGHWAHDLTMQAFSRALNTPIRFFDEPESTDLSDAFKIDQDAYDGYWSDYVKIDKSEDAPYWEIVYRAMVHWLNDHGHRPANGKNEGCHDVQ